MKVQFNLTIEPVMPISFTPTHSGIFGLIANLLVLGRVVCSYS